MNDTVECNCSCCIEWRMRIQQLESAQAGKVMVDREVYNGVKKLLINVRFSHETEYDGRMYEICDLCDKQDGEHTDDCLSHTGDKILEKFLSSDKSGEG